MAMEVIRSAEGPVRVFFGNGRVITEPSKAYQVKFFINEDYKGRCHVWTTIHAKGEGEVFDVLVESSSLAFVDEIIIDRCLSVETTSEIARKRLDFIRDYSGRFVFTDGDVLLQAADLPVRPIFVRR